MKIYFDGGSDMNGAELKNRYKTRFSRIISDYFGTIEYNTSMGGADNHRIVRQLLLNKNHISQFDYAIIQMTPRWRTEYHNGRKWERVMVPCKKCKPSSKLWLENTLAPQKVENEFWRNYFRIHSDEFFLSNEKMYQITIQSHCKAYGVPLIMLGRNQSSDLEFDFCFDESWISKAPDGHPNEEGHRQIADRIIGMLTKHK
jgi:hypothetical protein